MSDEQNDQEKADILFEQRLKKADELRETGTDPYANDFRVDSTIAEFVRSYQAEEDGEALGKVEKKHAIAGRVMAINSFGKAAFIRLQDTSSDEVMPNGEPAGRLQAYVRKNVIGEEAFAEFKKLDLGDFVGVVGGPMRTKTGELTVNAEQFRILTKTLRPMPSFLKLRLISKTLSKPPTTKRFRYSSGAIRR